jgi:hypothetical protein
MPRDVVVTKHKPSSDVTPPAIAAIGGRHFLLSIVVVIVAVAVPAAGGELPKWSIDLIETVIYAFAAGSAAKKGADSIGAGLGRRKGGK